MCGFYSSAMAPGTSHHFSPFFIYVRLVKEGGRLRGTSGSTNYSMLDDFLRRVNNRLSQ